MPDLLQSRCKYIQARDFSPIDRHHLLAHLASLSRQLRRPCGGSQPERVQQNAAQRLHLDASPHPWTARHYLHHHQLQQATARWSARGSLELAAGAGKWALRTLGSTIMPKPLSASSFVQCTLRILAMLSTALPTDLKLRWACGGGLCGDSGADLAGAAWLRGGVFTGVPSRYDLPLCFA